jgi:hypothetical protein
MQATPNASNSMFPKIVLPNATSATAKMPLRVSYNGFDPKQRSKNEK